MKQSKFIVAVGGGSHGFSPPTFGPGGPWTPGCPCMHLQGAGASLRPISAYPPHCRWHKDLDTTDTGTTDGRAPYGLTTLESSQQPSERAFSGSHDTSICWRSTCREGVELCDRSANMRGSKLLTHRHRAVPGGPFNDGGVPSEDNRPRLVYGFHRHLPAVYEQPHLTALHAQGQLVPLAIK